MMDFSKYSELPSEVKYNIALHKNYKDLMNSCISNREYNDICKDNYFWKRKTYYDFEDLYDIEEIEDNWRKNYQHYRRRFSSDFVKAVRESDNSLWNDPEIMLNLNDERQFLIVDYGGGTTLGSAFSWAALYGDKSIIEKLLSLGAVFNTSNLGRYTSLMFASREGHEEIVELLLSLEGIDVNAQNIFGETALMLASRRGREEIVELLLSFEGIDVNAQNNDGETALMLAIKENKKGIVELLLSFEGINLNIRRYDRKNAKDLALSYGTRYYIAYLIEKEERERERQERERERQERERKRQERREVREAYIRLKYPLAERTEFDESVEKRINEIISGIKEYKERKEERDTTSRATTFDIRSGLKKWIGIGHEYLIQMGKERQERQRQERQERQRQERQERQRREIERQERETRYRQRRENYGSFISGILNAGEESADIYGGYGPGYGPDPQSWWDYFG